MHLFVYFQLNLVRHKKSKTKLLRAHRKLLFLINMTSEGKIDAKICQAQHGEQPVKISCK
jgi:hypothetical protein